MSGRCQEICIKSTRYLQYLQNDIFNEAATTKQDPVPQQALSSESQPEAQDLDIKHDDFTATRTSLILKEFTVKPKTQKKFPCISSGPLDIK